MSFVFISLEPLYYLKHLNTLNKYSIKLFMNSKQVLECFNEYLFKVFLIIKGKYSFLHKY